MPTLIWDIATSSCLEETKHHLYQDGSAIIGAFFPIFHLDPLKETRNWETPFDIENELK